MRDMAANNSDSPAGNEMASSAPASPPSSAGPAHASGGIEADLPGADASADDAVTTQPTRKKPSGFLRFRFWVQTAFLLVWLGPPGVHFLSIPSCVFHCYACPMSTFACPIGVIANFSALHIFPLFAIGVLLMAGGLVGSLLCGWACPFGWLQDVLARVPLPKFRIPSWLGYGRYLVLVGLVVVVPYFWGAESPLFICRVCPAGGLEAALPGAVQSSAGSGSLVYDVSAVKTAIVVGFVLAAVFTYRPWCTILCPLGGFLALFNPFSLFHLRYKGERCTHCNLCRSQCAHGVEVDRTVNGAKCIRCLECTACGAITPNLPGLGGGKDGEQPPADTQTTPS